MSTFTYLGKLRPDDQEAFPQQISFDDYRHLTQSQASIFAPDGREVCRVSRYVDWKFAGTMHGLRSHGYPLFSRTVDDVTLVTLRHTGPGGKKVWVELPFLPGYTWSDADVLAHAVLAPPSYKPSQPYFSQGRVPYDGHLYELTGGSFDNEGPTGKSPDGEIGGPARLDVYRADGSRAGWHDASMLGRVGQKKIGAPNWGRLEPEGLALVELPDGRTVLVLCIACGRADDDTLTCYFYVYDLESDEARALRA